MAAVLITVLSVIIYDDRSRDPLTWFTKVTRHLFEDNRKVVLTDALGTGNNHPAKHNDRDWSDCPNLTRYDLMV
jgi:hypothetical protein